MSDFIPMISSSPPPLEDTPSFDGWGNDDGDDDFGGFASAHFPVKTPPIENLDLSSNQGMHDAISTNHADDLATSKLPDCDGGFIDKHVDNVSNSTPEIPPSVDNDGFGHFTSTIPPDTIGPFGDSSTTETAPKKTADARQMDNDITQQNICQSDITQHDKAKSIRTCRDDCCGTQSRQCSQDKASRDSGICSSEISPVTKSDDYQEFSHIEDDIDQFSALQSNNGSDLAVDTTGVATAVPKDVADNGFGSGTTTPSIEPQLETDSEPVNGHNAEYVPSEDCGKAIVCEDNLTESATTYQDASALIHYETVISETDQSEVKDTAGNECSADTHEHSSSLECGDSVAVVESTLKQDVNCESENRTDSEPKFCSGDSTLHAESASPELSESRNEIEKDSVKQSIENTNGDHTNTFQEISTPADDSLDEATRSVNSRSDSSATEVGTKANCDENGGVRLHDTTKVTQSECLGNGGETAVFGNDDDVCGFVDPINVDTKTLPESEHDNQQEQQSCVPPDDEDDGFSNFSTAAEVQNDDTENESHNQQEQPSCIDQDDGFGNFGTAADVQNDESEFDVFSGFKDSGIPSGESDWAAFHSGDLPRATEEDSEDDWAAFHGSGHQTRTASVGGDKEDDFGDFEEAEFGSFAQKTPPSVSIKPVTVDIRARMEAVLIQCFPTLQGGVDTHDVSPCLLIEVVMTELHRPLPDHRPAAGRHKALPTGTVDLNVWNRLKDIEETPALKYTWTASATSRQLLAAIAVDPRNMLLPHKKQSMPAFAADLGLLEPSRGVRREPTKSCDPIIIDTSKSPPPTATDPSSDIPPAEFDWNSSGLTNPLDALQKEQEILEAIETINTSEVKTLEPLENVLANMKFVSTAPSSVTTSKHDASNLTGDAASVIHRLPNLSFMHATVLMFPIKGDQ